MWSTCSNLMSRDTKSSQDLQSLQMLNFIEEALCLKDHKKQQDFDKMDKYEIWKNAPGPKLSTVYLAAAL